MLNPFTYSQPPVDQKSGRLEFPEWKVTPHMDPPPVWGQEAKVWPEQMRGVIEVGITIANLNVNFRTFNCIFVLAGALDLELCHIQKQETMIEIGSLI